MITNKRCFSLLEKLNDLQDSVKVYFERFLKKELLRAIRLQPDKEDIIFNLFKNSVISMINLKKNNSPKLITYMRESHQKSNLMIWNDKLNSYKNGQPTKELHIMLLKILVRELISREKEYKPFWTDAFKELSEMLPLPIAIDCPDSDLISSKVLLQKQEEPLQSLKITETYHQNKNSQKIYSASSISTAVDKWVSDHTVQKQKQKEITKTLTLTFYPTQEQKKMLDKNLHVSNYVYNKTINYINTSDDHKFTKLSLRDKLVTYSTRKNCNLFNKVHKCKTKIESIIRDLIKTKILKNIIKAAIIKRKYLLFIKEWYNSIKDKVIPTTNTSLKSFELDVHKDIRAGSVFDAYTNFNNCIKAINTGRIKHFKLKYRSQKNNHWSMAISKSMIKLNNGTLRFTDKTLCDKTIHMANRTKKILRNISLIKDCKITKINGTYELRLPININIPKIVDIKNVVGIDPGVSTFLSMYSPDKSTTIKQSYQCKYIDSLRARIKKLRKNRERKRIRRRLLLKLDIKQANVVNELHWQSINYLVKNYDLIFIEKFDTQGFVKNGKSKTLNRDTNNHKPYQFRQRLEYKAIGHGKIVSIVNAKYTTMTCSTCGNLQSMTLKDRIYNCSRCKCSLDRDFNAGKNILLKGLLH